MKILAVYIIRENGVPLLTRFYDHNARTIDGLVAPFLVSTTSRIEEITGSGVKEIALNDRMNLVIEQFAEVMVAVVVNDSKDTGLTVDLVARRFYKRYHSKLNNKGWTGNVKEFQKFIPEMEKLLEINSEIVIEQTPSEILDSFVMSNYDKSTQQLIRELIKRGEISHSDLVRLFDNQLVEKSMDLLIAEKYVGVKKYTDGRVIYFT